MSRHDLPTLAERAADLRGKPIPKGLPTPLVKEAKKKTKAQREKDFRAAVWTRDGGKSRASGKSLKRSGTNWDAVGEVHHVLKRSTHPEDIYRPENGILLSKKEHSLAETACPQDPAHCLLDIEGPEDRGKPQVFIWRDVDGRELRRKAGR